MRKVTLVINLEFPRKFDDNKIRGKDNEVKVDPETYLHRVGRTGRFGDHGICVNFIVNQEHEKQLNDIMAFYKSEIKELKSAGFEEINESLMEIDKYNQKKRNQQEEVIE